MSGSLFELEGEREGKMVGGEVAGLVGAFDGDVAFFADDDLEIVGDGGWDEDGGGRCHRGRWSAKIGGPRW